MEEDRKEKGLVDTAKADVVPIQQGREEEFYFSDDGIFLLVLMARMRDCWDQRWTPPITVKQMS